MAVHIPVIVDIEQAFADAAKKVKTASTPLRRSMEQLGKELDEDLKLFKGIEVNDEIFGDLAKDIQKITMEMEIVNDQFLKFTTNEGSIRRMNAEMASLNRRWEEMAAAQKFTSGGALSDEAKSLQADYKRVTEEIRRAGKSLSTIAAEEQRIAALRQKGIQSRRYENAILNTTVQTLRVLEEKERILSSRLSSTRINTDKYRRVKEELDGVRLKLDEINGRVKTATVPALDSAGSRLEVLVKRSAQLMALHAAGSFLRNIRAVTAEFEMQRVALGGIIQDADKASSLFKEIKAAAIRSPFEIKDLVTYTKQLSAYRVETENLFGVTMRLADVSAGLGVDMNRLILAYGQVKAASVLRGQELRQFTEAGIPLVKLLADKFSELRGEVVSTADVFELISKRQVPFEMISEIFEDMTNRGGIFYKMQEKQAETLLGQWNNLKDSLSIMYDEMGNTDTVHNAMTSMINDAKSLFQNWRLIANAIKIGAYQYAVFKLASLWMPNLRRELTLAKKAQDALTRATELSKYAQETGSVAAAKQAASLRAYSVLVKKASVETNFFSRSILLLKAAMSGGTWIGLVVAAVGALVSVISSAAIESRRLSKDLKKIGTDGATNISRAVSNFNRLADAAVNAARGSREQVEAVAELKRTYGDIIPEQELEASALEKLQGKYESLTRAIREKISEQIREQKVNTIVDAFGKKISKKGEAVKQSLAAYGLDKDQISAVMEQLQADVEKGMIGVNSTLYERRVEFGKIIKELTGVVVDFGNGYRDATGRWRNVSDFGQAEEDLNSLLDVYSRMNAAISDVDTSMQDAVGTYGKFAAMSKDLKESLAKIQVDTFSFGKKGTFSYNQELARQQVETYWSYLKKAFDEANKNKENKIDIASALLDDGKIDFSVIDKAVKQAMSGGDNTKLDSFVESIKEGYEKIVPSDRIINLVREKVNQFAAAYKVPMDEAQSYYKKADESIEDYVKSLRESENTLVSMSNQMRLNNKEVANGTLTLRAYSKEEVESTENSLSFVQALIKFFEEFSKKRDKDAYQQDPYIKQLEERMKFMQDFKRGYDELNKYLSANDALSKVSEKMMDRGVSLGLGPQEQQMAANQLSKWYEDMRTMAFEKVKSQFGVSGSISDFLRMEIKDTSSRGKALREFQKLIQSLWDAQTDLDISTQKRNLENALRRLKDEIKRSEVAKSFFDDLLEASGNRELAAQLTFSIYGDAGSDLEDKLKESLKKSFVIDTGKLPEGTSLTFGDIKNAIDNKDVVTLRKYLGYVVDDNKAAAEEVLASWEKAEEDWLKWLFKTYEKTKSFDERRAEVVTREEGVRGRIEKDKSLTPEQKDSQLNASLLKQKKDLAAIDVEEAKNNYAWAASFKDVERVSEATLTRLKTLLEEILAAEGELLTPESKKALEEALEKTGEGLSTKNPYAGLVSSFKRYSAAKGELNRLEREGLKYEKDGETLTLAYVRAMDNATEAADDFRKGINGAAAAFSSMSTIVESLLDILDLDENSDWNAALKGIAESLALVGTALVFINAMLELINANPIVAAISAVIAAVIAISKIVNNLSTAKADREIEAQQNKIENLEAAYEKLSDAISESFGNDYLYNYGRQIETLRAEVEAYRKQAELERSKGKKADEKKANKYEQNAVDSMEKIKDVAKDMQQFFAGSDLASLAVDFSDAWLEAYKEFGNTADAIEERMGEMVKNLVEKAALSGIVQNVLSGWYDGLKNIKEWNAASIAEKVAEARSLIPVINEGLSTAALELQSAGVQLRGTVGKFTGISRDIAGATEESISGLAAGVNTQNYFLQHIDENVSALRRALGADTAHGTQDGTDSSSSLYMSQVIKSLTVLPGISGDLAAIRAAVEGVVGLNGGKHSVRVQM